MFCRYAEFCAGKAGAGPGVPITYKSRTYVVNVDPKKPAIGSHALVSVLGMGAAVGARWLLQGTKVVVVGGKWVVSVGPLLL